VSNHFNPASFSACSFSSFSTISTSVVGCPFCPILATKEDKKHTQREGLIRATPREDNSPAKARSEDTTKVEELGLTPRVEEVTVWVVKEVVVVVVVLVSSEGSLIGIVQDMFNFAHAINLSSVVGKCGLAVEIKKSLWGVFIGTPTRGKFCNIFEISTENSFVEEQPEVRISRAFGTSTENLL